MPRLTTDYYTLVQHSGAGYSGKRGFARAVEERHIQTQAQLDKIRAAGGLVFDNYVAATDAAEAENYPPDVQGIYPRVHGSFARVSIDGLRVYVPRRVPTESTP